MGRCWAVGCVALEVTQRCNLDSTLCDLSESSEAVKDMPLAELIRRIGMIREHYGPGTDVQITGGEPTLKRRGELVEVVRHARAATFEAERDREARAFLGDERNVGVDHARRAVQLPEILDFFREDFLAKAPSLIAYVNRYRAQPIPEDYEVGFIPYNWTVAAR